ncbi:MAG: 1,4-dihydroxy-2-naphthoate octaprenyltransferase [candidate division Zixibacteria bacterium]|nr:1,4-dihydroxy-2-naphthoate octaprenyltransferase [candidate division Zixibacteria bacterium]
MNSIQKWITAVRAPFFTGIAIPIIFGGALAYYETGIFNWSLFIITLVGGIFAHAGANLANDYYDHKTTDDDINTNITPFSGGSRMIQNKLLSPGAMLSGAFVCWALALIAGIYLFLVTPGYMVLILAVGGFIGGYFYTASKFAFSYNRFGELAILVSFGILPVMGTYFVQTGQLSISSLITSIPIGFLITAILYINQYPDYDADKAAGKNHLVVVFGKKRAMTGYYFLIFGSYLVVILAVLFSYLTPYALFALATLPIAIRTARIFAREYEKVKELVPAMAGTIQIHLLTGLLMSIGCITGGILKG